MHQRVPVKVRLIEDGSALISKRVADAAGLGEPSTSGRLSGSNVPAAYARIQELARSNEVRAPSNTTRCDRPTIVPTVVKTMIKTEATRQGVDAKLALAIADQESGYGASVNSSAGARGIMQLMPETAAHYGVTDVCDAAQNIRGGIAFLKDLTSTFGGNIMLMVAAYNSGEDRVLKSGGIPSISETVNYTARVTNAYYSFDNTLKGGRRAENNSVADVRPQQLSDITELAVQGLTDTSRIPTNQPRSRTKGDRQQWIGGSVLYVQ